MHDFDTLVGELLSNRPELSREELMRRVAEKKETVGAGYLTDQGALFLVAGELGVTLKQAAPSSDLTIKDLYIGANDVTVLARVLAIYPVSTYKKKDGGEGKYRRLVLFDGNSSVKLTVWDDKAEEVEKLGVGIDSPVRITSGYVKQGLDGKPNLNLGKRGAIVVVPDDQSSSKLPKLSAVTEKLTKTPQERPFAAVECVVDSEPRYSEFVRSDGSPGSLFQFGAADVHGRHEARVVIWSPSSRPELRPGQKVVITNVKSKRSSNGEFEVHGDAGSVILQAVKKERVVLRIAAVAGNPSGSILLGLEEGGRIKVVEVGKDAKKVSRGDLVTITADGETDGRMVCTSPSSVEVVQAKDFPDLGKLVTKLKDAKDESSQIMVEVIALSHGTADDVRLKDGSAVKKGELVVGDDTAELKVVGWRDLSEKLRGIQPGERLRISGVSPKVMRMGGWVLQLNSLSVVEKLRGRD